MHKITKFPIPPPPDDEPATPESTRDFLLGDQIRPGPPIRSAFLQEYAGEQAPGPLHLFVRERRLFALQMYLLLHCIARKEPWDTALPATTWAGALDKVGAEGSVSRSWAWLKDHDLVRIEHRKRLVKAYLLCEDGSGEEYTRSRDYFIFPLAYFRDGWHTRLSLPATAVLLIALRKSRNKKQPWFQLRTEPQSAWYGISPDTLQRGLDELRDVGLLHIHQRRVRDYKARFGSTPVNEYLLLDAFATPIGEPRDALDEIEAT